MGLRDLFRKYKNRHNNSPCTSHTDLSKVHQQIPQQTKQNNTGLISIEKGSTL